MAFGTETSTFFGVRIRVTKAVRSIILPYGLTSDGEINESSQATCSGPGNFANALVVQDPNCLSIVQVLSQEGYVANVSIVDHLGKVVSHSKQRFGMGCGDLKEPNDRLTSKGYLRYLIWNQKNIEGMYVGSGVYIWKVIFKFTSGTEQISFYKQGVIRQDNPSADCLSNMQRY